VNERTEIPPVKVLGADELEDTTVTRVFAESRIAKARVIRELGQLAEHVYAANRKAEDVIARATVEAAEIKARAATEGRREGQRVWAEALVELERERARMVGEAEDDLLTLAVQLAGRIVGREIENEPSTAAEIVAETLQHVRGDRRITIEVAPADVPAVQSLSADLSAIVGGEPLVVRSNADIARGGCIVVTDSQRIDARLETQLTAIRRALETK
jgi:flagellar biosynthesis/type III secretory pathway protein FliH